MTDDRPTDGAAPAGDFPAESWIHVRILADDVPGAVRLRHWLKDGLRRHGIRAVRITGRPPADPAAAPPT